MYNKAIILLKKNSLKGVKMKYRTVFVILLIFIRTSPVLAKLDMTSTYNIAKIAEITIKTGFEDLYETSLKDSENKSVRNAGITDTSELNTRRIIEFSWSRPQLVNSVTLQKSENKKSLVSGMLIFSDKTNINLGTQTCDLIPHFSSNEPITFEPKMITSMRVVLLAKSESDTTQLSEIKIMGKPYTGKQSKNSSFKWDTPIPAGCPFPESKDIKGIEFTGRFRNYTNADTWYPAWAPDGNLYSPWTDGYILDPHKYTPFDTAHPGYMCHSCNVMGKKPATAQAKIIGSDPMGLKIENLPPRIPASPKPFEGRYPCGSLIKDGIWYYGTYCLTTINKPDSHAGWNQFGPFVGFRYSKNYGKTWTKTSHTPENPLFGEDPAKTPVKIGAPHFVDFGKNMQHSPDGKAYLVAQGSKRKQAWNNWIQADCVYLLRVTPSIENISPEAVNILTGSYFEDTWIKMHRTLKGMKELYPHNWKEISVYHNLRDILYSYYDKMGMVLSVTDERELYMHIPFRAENTPDINEN